MSNEFSFGLVKFELLVEYIFDDIHCTVGSKCLKHQIDWGVNFQVISIEKAVKHIGRDIHWTNTKIKHLENASKHWTWGKIQWRRRRSSVNVRRRTERNFYHQNRWRVERWGIIKSAQYDGQADFRYLFSARSS